MRTYLIVLLAAMLSGCGSVPSQPDRFDIVLVQTPQSSIELAKSHEDFAWLSVLAYNDDDRSKKQVENVKGLATCPTANDWLMASQWQSWGFEANEQVKKSNRETHLRVSVFERASPPTVVVAFGGTVWSNPWDWEANSRWLFKWEQDQYTEIQQGKIGNEFIRFLKKRAASEGGEFLNNPDLEIVTTGHSLGGGLAQAFAYWLPEDPMIRRVSAVYAFDSSPVTAFHTEDSEMVKLRSYNATKLKIDRVYERGEGRLHAVSCGTRQPQLTATAALNG